MAADALLTIDDVRAAAQRLAGRVDRTPVLTSAAFDDASGVSASRRLTSRLISRFNLNRSQRPAVARRSEYSAKTCARSDRVADEQDRRGLSRASAPT
jgi:phosphoheptose isomerase